MQVLTVYHNHSPAVVPSGLSVCICGKKRKTSKGLTLSNLSNPTEFQIKIIVSAHRRILGMASVVCVLVKICVYPPIGGY